MPLMYPLKHVYRNWKLFTALLIGITLAATFFAAIGVKGNLSAEQALDKQLSSVLTDMEFTASSLNQTNLELAYRNITSIPGVTHVDRVVRINSQPIRSSSDNFTGLWYPQIVTFPIDSRINNEWLNKPLEDIPENYTYLIAGSDLAKQVSIGDNITTMISFPQPNYWNQTTLYVNLTVAGFAQLTNNGYQLLSGNSGGIIVPTSPNRGPIYDGGSFIASPSYVATTGYRQDTLIISWVNTFMKIWNHTQDKSSTVSATFSIGVNRKALISPWNLPQSYLNIHTIEVKIQNEVLANYLSQGYLTDTLANSLYSLQVSFSQTLLSFLYVSIPVFFVAWYLGLTVSDVSFNIRRREIGLLSTKGLSSGQIQRMFLSEAVIIGFIGGALGLVGGLILNQYYAGTVNLKSLFSSQLYSPDLMLYTIIFGIVLSLFSVFWSSRKAARLPAVDTLRNYMPTQSTRTFMKALHWVAFILGSYKMVIFASGVSLQRVFEQLSFTSGGLFTNYIGVFVLGFDAVMTIFGPLFFFWGLTNILIRDSDKFQRLASKISSVMGDLGALAAKNVRRNPARLAAIAFLIAFIIGYSVQVTGQIASQQDYTLRTVETNAGADITVSVVNATKGQLILNDILSNVTGIKNGTVERSLTPTLSNNNGYGSTITIRAIDPENWSISAYYEQGWFSGASFNQIMNDLKNSNNTIIADKSLAQHYGLKMYDEIGINFDSAPRKLRIIGFFGPGSADAKVFSEQSGDIIGKSSSYNSNYFYSPYYSYVPNNLFNVSYADSGIYKVENFQTTLRLKLASGANGTEVADQIRTLEGNELYSVTSFDELWRQSQESNYLGTFSSMQILDIQGLGLWFAVISASVGTALIAVVSLNERSREATLMSVRGLSYRQLVWMFLTESMAVITFAVVLGVVVGVVIVYGNVASANQSMYSVTGLVTQRLIYPTNALATIGTYIALIYAATIGAIIVMTSQYVTKLEKMVRTR
jgi:ABC-type lipoprotein release transport system permease subunit